MTPQQWKQVKSLFDQIVKLSPTEEQSFLKDNCSDEDVRKEVESLLFYHRNGENFLPEKQPQPAPAVAPASAGAQLNHEQMDVRQNLNTSSLNSPDSAKSNSNVLPNTPDDFQGTSRFIIQKRLGAGGFGVVYQAYDRERDSVVALKTLRQAEATDLYLFKKEFRSLADLAHPNLAALYELFSDQNIWFFTMELIQGRDFLEYVSLPEDNLPLSKILTTPLPNANNANNPQNQPTTVSEIIAAPRELPVVSPRPGALRCPADLTKLRSALKQLVLGLIALHETDKLHRDIKPSNVLVTLEGRVVILDFGLVSDVSASANNRFSSHNIIGTPAYMSPEQARALPLSPASDWYSVGVMLYKALTEELPFTGGPMQMMIQKQRNVPPSPAKRVKGVPDDLDKLCQDLMQRDPQLRPTGSEILRLLGDQSGVAVIPDKTPSQKIVKASVPFVGREKELAILEQAWQSTRQGQHISLFIKGRSGMGKSAMVRHFLETLEKREADLLVLSGRCYEQESVPYKALDSLVDLLSKYLKSLSALEVEAILPLDVLALARLFPVLRQVAAVANSKRNILNIPDSQELRRKAFGALRELLARLANKKDLVLFIDDLQWGDLDSAILLREILRPPDAPGLLFIGSFRSEEADKSLFLQSISNPQADVAESMVIQEIALAELTEAEAQKLATALLGEATALKQAKTIVQESGGSPFFISELAQYALTTDQAATTESNKIEMTIDEVIGARVAQLPDEARRLLEVVAVAGQPLTRILAKKAAEIGADEQFLQILRVGHLLRSTGTSSQEEIDTYHDRIREAVANNLSPESRKAYHHSLATALEEANSDADSVDPERLAKHFQLAGEADKACDYTLSAAEKASEALAFDRAAQLYRQTLELKPSKDATTTSVKIKLGKALANAGKGAEAGQAYLDATNDTSRQGMLHLQHKAAEQFLNVGHIDEGLELLKLVLSKHNMKLAETPTSTIVSIMLGRAKLWLKGINFQLRPESEIPPEELTCIDVCWTVVDSLSSVDSIRAFDFQTKHLLLALKAGEPYRLSRALSLEAGIQAFFGRRSQARVEKFLRMSLALAEQINSPELLAMVNLVKGAAAFLVGQWQASWQFFCLGEKITREQCLGENYGFALRGIDNALTYALRALVFLGDLNGLLQRLPELLKYAEDRSNLFTATNLRTMVVYMKHLAADEPERAQQELNQTSDLWTKRGFHIQHYLRIFATAEIGLYSGRGREVFDQINLQWQALKKSQILRCQFIFIEAMHIYARTALTAAANSADSAAYLTIAEKHAKQILREKTHYGDAWAELILAGVAACRNRVELAKSHLSSAEQKFEAAHMALYLAAARRRRGELIGGDEGKALIADADLHMSEQQVKNPIRMTDMLVPGRWQK